MELRHFRYFVILADELNFTRAASRLNVAQSALSVQMRNLEQEVGTALFERGRTTRLTPAGLAFLERARDTLATADAAVAAARHATSGLLGTLSIGHNNPAEFSVLRRVVPAFAEAFPQIQLEFHNLLNFELLDALHADRVDIVFDWLLGCYAGLQTHVLGKEPLVALLPKGHGLASQPAVSIRALSQEKMILFPRARMPEAYREVEDLFIAAGAALNVIQEVDTPLSMMNFVAMGAGCALLPDYFRRVQCEGVVYRRIMPPNLVKSLAIIKKPERGGLADLFFGFTADILAS